MYRDPSAGPRWWIPISSASTRVQTPSPPKLNNLPMPSCQ